MVNEPQYKPAIEEVHRLLHNTANDGSILPRLPHVDIFRHVFRELNQRADYLATLARTHPYHFKIAGKISARWVQLHFDRGLRKADGCATSAWTLRVANSRKPCGEPRWRVAAKSGLKHASATLTSVYAELVAMLEGAKAVPSICWYGKITFDSKSRVMLPSELMEWPHCAKERE